jgi:hypothetical protein
MQPSNEEIDAAIAEEADAMKQFAAASAKETAASLKVKAARKRLTDAVGAKSALMHDLMAPGNNHFAAFVEKIKTDKPVRRVQLLR